VAAAPPARPAAAAAPKPTAAIAPARPSSGLGWTLVDVASRYLGVPYVWGGTSPSGFDCSGFVWYVYRKSGMPIPRDMWGQLQSGTRVTRASLQPGDIVFFAGTYEAGLSHDGIYIGGGRFIHAADYGLGVIVSSFSNAYYANHYFGATRPW
jgi:cell wall-associated NlpC family hydrolase